MVSAVSFGIKNPSKYILCALISDTLTGRTVVYFNTDGHPAEPVTDTSAFSCLTSAAGDPSPAPWL